MPFDPTDAQIRTIAERLVRKHGVKARDVAETFAAAMKAFGDTDGAATWSRVAKLVRTLPGRGPGADDPGKS